MKALLVLVVSGLMTPSPAVPVRLALGLQVQRTDGAGRSGFRRTLINATDTPIAQQASPESHAARGLGGHARTDAGPAGRQEPATGRTPRGESAWPSAGHRVAWRHPIERPLSTGCAALPVLPTAHENTAFGCSCLCVLTD